MIEVAKRNASLYLLWTSAGVAWFHQFCYIPALDLGVFYRRRPFMGALQRGFGIAAALAAIGLLGAGRATAEQRQYKDREYHVQNATLKWGKQNARFTAIHVPDLANPDTSAPDLARKLNAIAKVGGQAVVYDLHGFNENGSEISEEGLQAFRDARHQHDWRRMNAMCRVFAEDAPEDFRWRRRAVKTAAKALQDELKVVYWIDGPRCEELVAMFHRHAPHLVVAAYEGGDVNLVRVGEAVEPGTPNIYTGWSQPALDGSVNVILPPGEASYQALETASIDPVEKEPWEPDNSGLSEAERADGFIALFDGKTLNGWHPKDGAGMFAIEDGTITRVGRGSQLRTRDRFDNFILRLEWRMEDGGNSGIFIRAPRAARFSKIGMEFQLLNDGVMEPGHTGLGGIYEAQAPITVARKPPMEWNTVEIKCDGAHLVAWLNGEKVQDIDLDSHEELQSRLRDGFIALQDHGAYVQFRNIRLKEL